EASSVVVVGAGGLGSPSTFYLAAAGVGQLRLIDDDVVDRSNLQRQILHVDADTGVPKVESARTRLSALNPRVQIEAVRERLTSDNVERLLADAGVVVDGGDHRALRYAVVEPWRQRRTRLAHGRVDRAEARGGVHEAGRQRGAARCYRRRPPGAPPAEAAPRRSGAAVLGAGPGGSGT